MFKIILLAIISLCLAEQDTDCMEIKVPLISPQIASKESPVQTPTERAILHLAPGIEAERLNTLSALIPKYAESNNLDPLFVVSVIRQESNFNPNARGSNLYEEQEDGSLKYVGHCCGYMQLHTMHGIEDVYDPEVNISAGCVKLRKYIDQRDGNLRRGLWRWGLTNYQAGQVLDRYVELLKLFGGEYELIEAVQ